ncbi:MAG: PfkB family carbohydrate kinase [Oscillospiraceae bacterium]|nr:PfkB family carbohydrate kinase [Oscillospiraceae bacterium]
MIYTLTLNPALDYVVNTSRLKVGGVNRANKVSFIAGGKGINVSRALNGLGVKNLAISFVGDGFVGTKFAEMLTEEGLNSLMISCGGCDTRLNTKIHSDYMVTEINGNFAINESIEDVIETIIPPDIKAGDFFVMGGSLPIGLPNNFYAELSIRLSAKGVFTVIDTSGEALCEVITAGSAFLLAPNEDEWNEIPGSTRLLLQSDMKQSTTVLISRGKDGAELLLSTGELGGKRYYCPVSKVADNAYTVGAGDTLLAGFIAEYAVSGDWEKSLKSGVKLAEEYVNGEPS